MVCAAKEVSSGFSSVMEVSTPQQLKLKAKPLPMVFTFDAVLDDQSTQEQCFHIVGRPLAEAALRGFNRYVAEDPWIPRMDLSIPRGSIHRYLAT